MFWLILALVLDQITKYTATLYLQGEIKNVLGIFFLTYTTNKGVAFGLLAGVKEIVVYLSLTIVVVMALIPTFFKLKRSTEMLVAFILGGALGNLIDRIRFGYVIDFITIIHWPTIFNVADMFILFGSVGLIIEMIIAESRSKREKKRHELDRREIGGHKSNEQGKWLATRQIRTREDTGMDFENIHPKSDKERGSNGEWNFEEAELQGEVWGYNYIGNAGQTDTTSNRTGEYPT